MANEEHVPAPQHSHAGRSARARNRFEDRKRTQETFGAATPGRRVLYSASWALPRAPRRGGRRDPRTVRDDGRGGQRSSEESRGNAGKRMTNGPTSYAAKTSRPSETVSAGRRPSTSGVSNGSAS